jgi:DNA-binding FrmR family transcriptional regulator
MGSTIAYPHPVCKHYSMATDSKGLRGYSATKDQLVKRLRRVEGQVRGVERMVEEERYCIDVVTQINAVQAALDKISLGLLDDHARHCMRGKGTAPSDPDAQVDELMGAVGRLLSR